MANIEHPNIDFVIETLFYTYSRDANAAIRKASLISLDILHRKSEKLQQEQANYAGVYDHASAGADPHNSSMNSYSTRFLRNEADLRT